MSRELFSVVRQGNLEQLKAILDEHSDVDLNELDENGDHLLHWSVFCGHTALCEELLKRGADWRLRTSREGYTVLHDAAWDG